MQSMGMNEQRVQLRIEKFSRATLKQANKAV